MDAFDAAELIAAHRGADHVYVDLLDAGTLSLGLAIWPAGSVDTQQPHTEDEVYYVVEGRARITVAGEVRPVGPGSIVFVGIGVEHRFHDIEEDLRVLVFWAPPRHARRRAAGSSPA
jgi:mannose-6-phosphate isomerase-like protein (cupin superfamily)